MGSQRGAPALPHAAQSVLVAFAVVGAVVGLVLALLLLYFGSRMQFVLFDMVVLRDDRVGPSWARHRYQTWRWIGVKVVAGLCLAAVFSPLLIPAALGFMRISAQPPAAFGVRHLGAVFAVTAEFFLVFFIVFMLLRLFTQLALPGLAMEDLRFGQVFQRVWTLFQADVRGMLLYFLLQPLVTLGASLATGVALGIALVVTMIPLGLAGWALWAALHGSTAGIAVLVVLGTVTAVAILAAILAVYLLLVGLLGFFTEAWALYFLAGRYPLLGQYLEPAPVEPPIRLGFPETVEPGGE